MKRIRIIFASAALYEAVRTFFILAAQPEQPVEILPLSWYCAAPLLVLPFILQIYLLFSEDIDKNVLFSTVLLKLMGIISYTAYFFRDISYAVSSGPLNNYYSLKILMSLLIFSLIDGIIIVYYSVLKKHHAEGDVCR